MLLSKPPEKPWYDSTHSPVFQPPHWINVFFFFWKDAGIATPCFVSDVMNDLDASESGGKDKYDVLRNCAGMGHAGEFPNQTFCDSPVNHLHILINSIL